MTTRSPAQRRHTVRLAAEHFRPKAKAVPDPTIAQTGSWWLVTPAAFAAALERELPRLTAPKGKAVYRTIEDEG